MTLRASSLWASVVLAAASSFPLHAPAQSFRLNRYAPPPTSGEGLALPRPVGLAPREWDAGLVLDYADDPLVLELESGFPEAGSIPLVDHQLHSHFRFAYGLHERWLLSVGAETVLLMRGEAYPFATGADAYAPADGAGLGDARLGVRFLALDGRNARLALEFEATAPLARAVRPSQRLSGARGPTFHPRALGEVSLGPGRITAALGVAARSEIEAFETELGDEITFGLGAGVVVDAGVGALELLVDLAGSTDTGNVWGDRSTALESLVGLRWQGRQWKLGVGGGAGWLRGVGSPAARVLASVGFSAHATLDADSDGIPDRVDACPNRAEDFDAYQDEDGCPDPDNDGDGVGDATDRCGSQAEDLDGFQDGDGCPDPDNDHDGHLDNYDRCPDAAEDLDGFQDDDGCAEFDNDGDGILDADDACPDEAGGLVLDGCPASSVTSKGVGAAVAPARYR